MTHGRRPEGTSSSDADRRRRREAAARSQRTGDPRRDPTRTAAERQKRAPSSRTATDEKKRATSDRPRAEERKLTGERPTAEEKSTSRLRDLEKGESTVEQKLSKPEDLSTTSNSSTEPETKAEKKKSWLVFPRFSFGRAK